MKKHAVILVIAFMVSLTIVPVVSAAPLHQQGVDWTDPILILKWIVTGGAALLAGRACSIAGKRWTWFQKLAPYWKLILQLSASGLLALLAYLALDKIPPEFFIFLKPYWQVVVLAALAALENQRYYSEEREKEKTAEIQAGVSQNLNTSG